MVARLIRRAGWCMALAAVALGVSTGAASASAPTSRALSANTRFFVPRPNAGAEQQIRQLRRQHDGADAELLRDMVTTPQAVWFTKGTPEQVRDGVRDTMESARDQEAVPVLVAYDVPGRDCAQFSAGGALDMASYLAWIDGFASGIGRGKAVVILEPDSLGLLPSSCGGPKPGFPFTDALTGEGGRS